MLLFTVILLFSSELFGFSVINIHHNLNHWNFQSLRKAYSSLIEAVDHRKEPDVSIEFEKVIKDGPIPMKEREFIIQGWRWHTKSLLRDLDRFTKIIQKSQENSFPIGSKEADARNTKLMKCYDFVFGFNWKSLIRVERDIFFPWLQDILPESSKRLISTIIAKHARINELIIEVGNACSSCDAVRKDNSDVIAMLVELKDSAIEIQRMQNNYFVPFIAAYVSTKEQSKFNRKVISSLGLLTSQIMMVAMLESIQDEPGEIAQFEIQIPAVARALIPVWRSQFYRPRSQCLDELLLP